MCDFLVQQRQQGLQLCIMLRCNIRDHQCQQLKGIRVLLQLASPCLVVHVREVNLDLLADREEVGVAVLHVEVVVGGLIHIQISATILLKLVDGVDGLVDQLKDTLQRQIKGIDGAFQSLQQVNAHEPLDTLFTATLSQVVPLVVRQVDVLRQLTGEDVVGRCVYDQTE